MNPQSRASSEQLNPAPSHRAPEALDRRSASVPAAKLAAPLPPKGRRTKSTPGPPPANPAPGPFAPQSPSNPQLAASGSLGAELAELSADRRGSLESKAETVERSNSAAARGLSPEPGCPLSPVSVTSQASTTSFESARSPSEGRVGSECSGSRIVRLLKASKESKEAWHSWQSSSPTLDSLEGGGEQNRQGLRFRRARTRAARLGSTGDWSELSDSSTCLSLEELAEERAHSHVCRISAQDIPQSPAHRSQSTPIYCRPQPRKLPAVEGAEAEAEEGMLEFQIHRGWGLRWVKVWCTLSRSTLTLYPLHCRTHPLHQLHLSQFSCPASKDSLVMKLVSTSFDTSGQPAQVLNLKTLSAGSMSYWRKALEAHGAQLPAASPTADCSELSVRSTQSEERSSLRRGERVYKLFAGFGGLWQRRS